MDYYSSYRELMEKLDLPANPEEWTNEQEAQWNAALDELEVSFSKKKEEDEDFYLIKSTLHMDNGQVRNVTSDVRTFTLEQLENVITLRPEYIPYYYERLNQKDSE